MDFRVLLLLPVFCIQGLSANGNPAYNGDTKDPMSDEATAKIAQELQKLRLNGNRFKQEMLKHSPPVLTPGNTADSIVHSGNGQAETFGKLSKDRFNALKSPNSPRVSQEKSWRYVDDLKKLERQVLNTLQTPARKGSIAPTLPGLRKLVPEAATSLRMESSTASIPAERKKISNEISPKKPPMILVTEERREISRGVTPPKKDASVNHPTERRKEVKSATLPRGNSSGAHSLGDHKEVSKNLIPKKKDPVIAAPAREHKEVKSAMPLRGEQSITLSSGKWKELSKSVTPLRKDSSGTPLAEERKKVRSTSPPKREPSATRSAGELEEMSRSATLPKKEPFTTILTKERNERMTAIPLRGVAPTTLPAEERSDVRNATPLRKNQPKNLPAEEHKESKSAVPSKKESSAILPIRVKNVMPRLPSPLRREPFTSLTAGLREPSRLEIPMRRELSAPPLERRKESKAANPTRWESLANSLFESSNELSNDETPLKKPLLETEGYQKVLSAMSQKKEPPATLPARERKDARSATSLKKDQSPNLSIEERNEFRSAVPSKKESPTVSSIRDQNDMPRPVGSLRRESISSQTAERGELSKLANPIRGGLSAPLLTKERREEPRAANPKKLDGSFANSLPESRVVVANDEPPLERAPHAAKE